MFDLRTVGVVGAGLMGSGIAQVAADAGLEVVLVDTDPLTLDRATESMRSSLERLRRKASSEATADDRMESPDAVLDRITSTTDLDSLAGADLVVEAVFEEVELKQAVFRALSKICAPDAVLCTNTSAIPITFLAAACDRPDRVVGTHFFSPVPMRPLCELVRGQLTSDDALDSARSFAELIGKTCIVVNHDSAGFVTSKIGAALCNDAVRMVEDGLASPEDVDLACRLGFGHPMGPFELMDLTGLDVQRAASLRIHEETGDPRFLPPRSLERLVVSGRLGRKTGRGWYDYGDGADQRGGPR